MDNSLPGVLTLWEYFGFAVHVRVTNTTMLADLQQMVVEKWDAITTAVDQTSMRRRYQAAVAVHGSSTCY